MEINEKSSMSLEGIFTNGKVDTPYSSNIKVNTQADEISYSIELGSLPVGLYLSQQGNTIMLEGIPTKSGTYAFILRVSDATEYVEKLFRVTIVNKESSNIDENIALYGEFNNCELGTTYLTYYKPNRIILSGQHRPYTPSLIRGELPSGMSVVRYGYSVCLVGTPNKVGEYTFTLRFTGIGNHYNEEEFTIMS